MQKPKQIANQAKKWFANAAKIIGLALPVVLMAKPAFAYLPLLLAGAALSPLIIDGLATMITGVIGIILVYIYNLGQFIINNVVAGTNDLLMAPGVIDAWNIMLQTANVLLFLALGTMAIMIILGRNNYNLKKALSSLIYAVVAANLSYEIVRLIVSLGDSLVSGIKSAFGTDGGSNAYRIWSDGMQRLFDVSPLNNGDFIGDVFSTSHTVDSILIAIITISILAVGAFAMFRVAIVLIERTIQLMMLVILAPLVFILQLFPGVAGIDKLASDWWQNLIKWTLVLPLVYILLGVAGLLMPDGDFNLSLRVAQVITNTTGSGETFWTEILQSIAAIAITISAGGAASLIGLKSVTGNVLNPVNSFIKKYSKDVAGQVIDEGKRRSAENLENAAESKNAFIAKPAQFVRGFSARNSALKARQKANQEKVEKIEKERGIELQETTRNKLEDQINLEAMALANSSGKFGKFENVDEFLANKAARTTYVPMADGSNKARSEQMKELNKSIAIFYAEQADKKIARGETVPMVEEELRNAFKKYQDQNTSEAEKKKLRRKIGIGIATLDKYKREGGNVGTHAETVKAELLKGNQNRSIAYASTPNNNFDVTAPNFDKNRISQNTLQEFFAEQNEYDDLEKKIAEDRQGISRGSNLGNAVENLDRADGYTVKVFATNRNDDKNAQAIQATGDIINLKLENQVKAFTDAFGGLASQKQNSFNSNVLRIARTQNPEVAVKSIQSLIQKYPELAKTAVPEIENRITQIMATGITPDNISDAVTLEKSYQSVRGTEEEGKYITNAQKVLKRSNLEAGIESIRDEIDSKLDGKSLLISAISKLPEEDQNDMQKYAPVVLQKISSMSESQRQGAYATDVFADFEEEEAKKLTKVWETMVGAMPGLGNTAEEDLDKKASTAKVDQLVSGFGAIINRYHQKSK